METCTLALSLLRTAAPDIMIPKIEDNTICSLWSVHYADYESDRLADWSRLHQEIPSISIECPVRHLKTMDLDVCKQWHLAAKLFQTSKIITHFIQKERTVFMVFIRLPRRCFAMHPYKCLSLTTKNAPPVICRQEGHIFVYQQSGCVNQSL